MKTMTSVLRHGRTVWDSDLLPEDEYSERVRLMRGRMEDLGLDILIGLGHTTRTGDFTYLSGHVPPLNWMAAVLGRQVGPLLVTGGGSRDVPFLSTQSWLTDIRTSTSLFSGPAAVIGNVIEEMAEPGARIGLAGVEDALDSAQVAEFTRTLSAYEVVDAGPLVAEVRALKRRRELLAMSDSLAIARRAMDAGLQAWRDGATTADRCWQWSATPGLKGRARCGSSVGLATSTLHRRLPRRRRAERKSSCSAWSSAADIGGRPASAPLMCWSPRGGGRDGGGDARERRGRIDCRGRVGDP